MSSNITNLASHNEFGRRGELLARKYLEAAGFEILDENWTFGKSEVDLIAFKSKLIIFVEVKSRSRVDYGYPEDFVGAAKQKLLAMAADEYVHLMDFDGEVRFDIISVLMDRTGDYSLTHIEDAFWPE